MHVWIWSAGTGVGVGLTVFALALVPMLAWQFRRYGKLNIARLCAAAAASVYVAALVVYTQFPVPETRSLAWCEAHGVQGVQLVPFESFRTMLMRADEIGWGPMFASTLGMQVILNVVLMIPLGVFVRGFFHTSWITVTGIGFLVSLAIEATQATGVWGLYPCAYRLGDVDDLISNTLGAFIGAVIAPLVLFWIPKRAALEMTRLQPRPVTGFRRLLAMVLNYGIIWSTHALLSLIMVIAWRRIDGKVDVGQFEWMQWGAHALLVVAVIFVPAFQGRGSLGQHLVWLAPRWRTSEGRLVRGHWWQRFARAAVLGVPLMLVGIPGIPGASSLFSVLAFISLVMIAPTRTHRSLSGVLSGAEHVDTRLAL